MELIIGIAVGIIIGLVVGTLIFRRRYIPVGDLRIDRSDPTSEPFLFLELRLMSIWIWMRTLRKKNLTNY